MGSGPSKEDHELLQKKVAELESEISQMKEESELLKDILRLMQVADPQRRSNITRHNSNHQAVMSELRRSIVPLPEFQANGRSSKKVVSQVKEADV